MVWGIMIIFLNISPRPSCSGVKNTQIWGGATGAAQVHNKGVLLGTPLTPSRMHVKGGFARFVGMPQKSARPGIGVARYGMGETYT